MTASMRIHRVRVPFRVPFATAAGRWSARQSWLLRLENARGRTGWGEAVLDDPADAPVLEALLTDVVASGLPPSSALIDRAGAAGLAFRAALDAARQDMSARRPGEPSARRTVGVNATIGAGDPEAAVEAAVQAVAAGYGTLKLKAAPRDGTAALLARLGAIRGSIPEDVALRLDVNGTWDLRTATRRLRAMAGIGLQYVEQPLPPGSVEEMARLRARVGTPVAADEAVSSVAAARVVLDAGAADVLVVKPGRVGGPVAVAEIARLAADHGVPVVISSMFETGIGLAAGLACAAALPDVDGWPAGERDHGLATADLLEDDLIVRPFLIDGGRMRAPGGRGTGRMGVTVDMAAVERYRRMGR